MNEKIKAYYVADDIDEVLNYIDNLEQENKQLKEQNEKEFADFIKFKQEQYDEYLEQSNELIKEKQHYKHIINKLEKWLEKVLNELKQNDIYDRTSYETGQIIATECIIAKIQELKGSDKNDCE